MALIVIAEDEFLLADLLATMVQDAGHDAITAPHGQAALSIIREKLPDLVITDYMMPLMTGLELARAIRSDGGLSHIPIILVSGAQGSIGRAHPDMFDAVFDKPYDERALFKAVGAILAAGRR